MVSLNFTEMATPSSLFSVYASMSTSIMLFRTMFDQLVPRPVQQYILSNIRLYWKPKSTLLSLVIEEKDGMSINHIFQASETYLCSKAGSKSEKLKITKSPKEKHFNLQFAQTEKTVDLFQGVELKWQFVREESEKKSKVFNEENPDRYSLLTESRYFELSFEKKHKDFVLDTYLPYVIQRAEAIRDEKKVLKLYNLERCSYSGPVCWDSVNLQHPSTFEKLAMDPKLKRAIIDDLDLFVERKEFYRKVGKAWKRGYLLYGPPGTGKSSLIAAMANYLKFDIYDLQLSNIKSDSSFRKLLVRTTNRSILVIEDIDCSVDLPDRNSEMPKTKGPFDPQFSLSGLLNFIDGLWSSCGDERIIIFTTNNKDKLDQALLRPGRMDMHIHMSYLTIDGFKLLATNYLDIREHHWRFGEIEELIANMNVTPAEVAEELMRSNDAEISLAGLANFLKRKKMEDDEVKKGIIKEADEVQEAKKSKIDQ